METCIQRNCMDLDEDLPGMRLGNVNSALLEAMDALQLRQEPFARLLGYMGRLHDLELGGRVL